MREKMTAPETARFLNIGMNRLYSLLLSGRLPGKRVDGRWEIDVKDARERLAAVEKYKRHDNGNN